MSQTTLLRACVATLREHMAGYGKPTETTWRAFCSSHEINASVKQDADRLIAWLPQACELMTGMLEDSLETQENKTLCSVAINYVLMPFDLIPDGGEHAVYGFLDDAILVALCAREMMADAPKSLRENMSEIEVCLDHVRGALPENLNDRVTEQIGTLERLGPPKRDDWS